MFPDLNMSQLFGVRAISCALIYYIKEIQKIFLRYLFCITNAFQSSDES